VWFTELFVVAEIEEMFIETVCLQDTGDKAMRCDYPWDACIMSNPAQSNCI